MNNFRIFCIQFLLIFYIVLCYKNIFVSGQAVAMSYANANGATASASSSSSVGTNIPEFGLKFGYGIQGNHFFQPLNPGFIRYRQPNFPIIPQLFVPPNIVRNEHIMQNLNNDLANKLGRPQEQQSFNDESDENDNYNKPNQSRNGSNNRNTARKQNQRPHNKHNNNSNHNNKNNNNNKHNNNESNNKNKGNNNNRNQKSVINTSNQPHRSNQAKPNRSQGNSNAKSNNMQKQASGHKPKPNSSTTKSSLQSTTNPTLKPLPPLKSQNTNLADYNGNIPTNADLHTDNQQIPNWLLNTLISEFQNYGGILPNYPQIAIVQIQNPDLHSNNSQYPDWSIQTSKKDGIPLPPWNFNQEDLVSDHAESPLFKPVPQLQPSKPQLQQLSPTFSPVIADMKNRPHKIPEKLQPGIIINPDSPYYIENLIEKPSALIDMRRR